MSSCLHSPSPHAQWPQSRHSHVQLLVTFVKTRAMFSVLHYIQVTHDGLALYIQMTHTEYNILNILYTAAAEKATQSLLEKTAIIKM